MILVTQGFEQGIGPEVFIKAILCLPKKTRNLISFFCEEKTLFETCKIVGAKPEQILTSGVHFHLFKRRVFTPQSTQSLSLALENIDSNLDVLLTLPTKKDQLTSHGTHLLGHTEYFRKKFKSNNLSMVFKNQSHYLLLLTDHMGLIPAVKSINSKLIYNKISITLTELQKYFLLPKKVVFSGINPHAGEFGLLGNDSRIIGPAIRDLKKKFPSVEFIGPLSGDAIYNSNQINNSLFVFAHHDQGLGPFKTKFGLSGWNITLGMPFLRVSPDFGTAPNLYGKNIASYMGIVDIIENSINLQGHLV